MATKYFKIDLFVNAGCVLNTSKKKVVVDTYAAGVRFDAGATYTIEYEAGFVKGTENNEFLSPANTNAGSFTTNSTGPQVQTDVPSGSSVTNNTFIRYTYDRQLLAGNGNYYLYKVGSPDVLLQTYNPSDSTANNTISGNQITLVTTGLIDAGETYYVLIDQGAVEDKDGLAAFGFNNDQEHRWSTAASTNVDFPDLSAVLTDAFTPTITANITVNPVSNLSTAFTLTPTANKIAGGEASLFTQISNFVARPNFTWDNAQSVSSQASQSTTANFTTTNNPAPLTAEVDIGTPWFERLLINDSDQVDIRFTPDGTKYVRFYTNPSNQYEYKAEVYDFDSGSLLNTIPSTNYRSVGSQSSPVNVGTFALDNSNIYVGIRGNVSGSSQTEGQIQKLPFTFESGDTIAYITDPDYYADNNTGGSPGTVLDPVLYNISSSQIKMLDGAGTDPGVLYTIDTSSFSVTHTFVHPTINASDITDLAFDVDTWGTHVGGTKTLITAPFYSVSNSNNLDLTQTLMKVYQNSTFKCDLAIPSGYKTTSSSPICAVNSSYAAVMLQSTTDSNDYKIRVYDANNGSFVRDIQDWRWNKSGVGLQNSDANEVLDTVPTYLEIDPSNNVYYRLYNLATSDSYYNNGTINNYPTRLTRIRDCATGNQVADFDIPGTTTEYPQEDRIIGFNGRYLDTIVTNQGNFIQIWHK